MLRRWSVDRSDVPARAAVSGRSVRGVLQSVVRYLLGTPGVPEACSWTSRPLVGCSLMVKALKSKS